MMPAPTMTTCLLISPNPPAKWVFLVKQLRGLGIHKCRARDDRCDLSGRTIQPGEFSRERAADDAFLHPGRAFGEFPIRRQAREFRARARAARRAVIGFAGTLHEV